MIRLSRSGDSSNSIVARLRNNLIGKRLITVDTKRACYESTSKLILSDKPFFVLINDSWLKIQWTKDLALNIGYSCSRHCLTPFQEELDHDDLGCSVLSWVSLEEKVIWVEQQPILTESILKLTFRDESALSFSYCQGRTGFEIQSKSIIHSPLDDLFYREGYQPSDAVYQSSPQVLAHNAFILGAPSF